MRGPPSPRNGADWLSWKPLFHGVLLACSVQDLNGLKAEAVSTADTHERQYKAARGARRREWAQET
eukprot:1832231-Pyramimonas_sp.AAC.1